MDASNSVRDRFKFEQEAAIEFLNSIIRPRYDKAFVVGFDATPEVTQDFTDNTESLSTGVRMLRAGGGTAMYDALYFACRDKLMKQEQTGPVRRAIILLSDGDDNLSHVTREEAIEMAQRADVIVYTISTNISGMKGKGDKSAGAHRGSDRRPRIFSLPDARRVGCISLHSGGIAQPVRGGLQAGGFCRRWTLPHDRNLGAGKGLKVRTRKGYYAPKQYDCERSVFVNHARIFWNSAAKKLGIKDDFRAALLHVPDDVKAELQDERCEMPYRCSIADKGKDFDFIFLFANREPDWRVELVPAAKALAPAGMLWISWPKKEFQAWPPTLPKM